MKANIRLDRMAGKLWFFGGLLLVLLGLSPLRAAVLYPVFFAVTMLMALIPTGYSFLLWRRENPQPRD